MLRSRVITGVTLGIVFVTAILLLPTELAALLFGLFWLAGAWEWAGLIPLGSIGRLIYAGMLMLLVLALLLSDASAQLGPLLWLAAAGWALALIGVVTYPRQLWGPGIAVAGFLALLPAWAAMFMILGSGPRGPLLALTGIGIVGAADVGAFFVGRRFGQTKLAPDVSPGKTWEGVAGGVGFAVLVGGLAAIAFDLPPILLLVAAAAIAPISVVGDLTVSMLKRRVGLKDCSQLLPGHGGVMDRFDGITAALPFFALALQFGHVLD